jgi:AcrR family transcriptional regulator
MAIYHHLPNKAAVISGLVQTVFSQMQLPASTGGDWAQQVRAWVHAYRDLTRAHPHLVLQIVTDPVSVNQAAEMIQDPLHAALMAAGVPAAKVPACAGLLVDYVNGFSLADAGPRPLGGPSQAEFDTGLDVILLGLEALAAGKNPP